MQRRLATSITLALAGLGLLTACSTRSDALPAVQNVAGVYNGYFDSALPDGNRGEIQITIAEQRGRRVVGSVSGPGLLLPAVQQIEGTITPRGVLRLRGLDRNLRAGDGSVRVFCDGSVRVFGDGSVRLLALYRTEVWPGRAGRGRPAVDVGVLALLRDSAGTGLPAVQGTWSGRSMPNPGPPEAEPGPLTLGILYQAGSLFRGTISPGEIVGLLPATPPFEVAGDIGLPTAEAPGWPFHIVGLGEAGWLFAEGTFDYPPNPCVGRYHVLYFDGTWETGTFELTMEPRT